jgi:transposase
MSIIKYISNTKKILILEYWLLNNKPETKVLSIDLGVSKSTINKILREYRLDGTITLKSKLSKIK